MQGFQSERRGYFFYVHIVHAVSGSDRSEASTQGVFQFIKSCGVHNLMLHRGSLWGPTNMHNTFSYSPYIAIGLNKGTDRPGYMFLYMSW